MGDMVPVMAGIALTFRMRGQARVGMVYVGDGATSTGAFHEGVNFAAVMRVPLVIVVEHNGYAYSTPTSRQAAVTRLADKAYAYGIPGETVDGNDVFAVYQCAKDAVDRARRGDGVSLIEVVTYRRKGHAEHDDQRYQPGDEIARWERSDPVDRYVTRLREAGWAQEGELQAIDARVGGELEDALQQCERERLPPGESALSGVFADPATAAPLWFRRADA